MLAHPCSGPRTAPVVTLALLWGALALGARKSRQATGVKAGEVTETSAIVWMRVTARAERRSDGPKDVLPASGRTEDLEGACPGAPGRVRVRYGLREDLDGALETTWVEVQAERDFSHQFKLENLKAASVYHFAAHTASPDGKEAHAPLVGRFETAPPPDTRAGVTFTVITGQAYRSVDDPRGHGIYEAMLALQPHFMVHTGDIVYYDNDPPNATSVELARQHWNRLYSLPRLSAFHLRVPCYFEKDDHDTVCNDCWPSMKNTKNPPLTFEEGQRIFRQQVPMDTQTHRTFRWGKGLQIWLTEGRDFRSSNKDPDGPEKSIWGAEQKKWLKESILASDADWRILISPTPLVGPDRGNKGDNHANAAFAHEGREIREWIRDRAGKNFFVACGDRHWQYHSVDPDTGVREFCCGPTTDKHAGGSPGEEPRYHRFHRVGGGFLAVTIQPAPAGSTIIFRHHDVHGKVVHEWKPEDAKP